MLIFYLQTETQIKKLISIRKEFPYVSAKNVPTNCYKNVTINSYNKSYGILCKGPFTPNISVDYRVDARKKYIGFNCITHIIHTKHQHQRQHQCQNSNGFWTDSKASTLVSLNVKTSQNEVADNYGTLPQILATQIKKHMMYSVDVKSDTLDVPFH